VTAKKDSRLTAALIMFAERDRLRADVDALCTALVSALGTAGRDGLRDICGAGVHQDAGVVDGLLAAGLIEPHPDRAESWRPTALAVDHVLHVLRRMERTEPSGWTWLSETRLRKTMSPDIEALVSHCHDEGWRWWIGPALATSTASGGAYLSETGRVRAMKEADAMAQTLFDARYPRVTPEQREVTRLKLRERVDARKGSGRA